MFMRNVLLFITILLLCSTVFSASIIQLRRDVNSSWFTINPVLAQGEAGINLSNLGLKFGDGSTHWNDLNYYSTYGDMSLYLLKNDFNSFLLPQTCPVGFALRSLGSSVVCVSVGGAYSDSNTLGVINSLDLNNSLSYLKTIDLNSYITISQADSNYWSKTNNFITVSQADVNYQVKGSYVNASQLDSNLALFVRQVDGNFWYVKLSDFNSLLALQSCPVGQALRVLGSTPTCVAVGGIDTNCAVTHSCNNVLYQVDGNAWYYKKTDFNYLTFLTSYDTNFMTAGLSVADINNLWRANGNDIYNLNSGNVGIGTTSPAQKLEIAGDANQGQTPPTLRITNTRTYPGGSAVNNVSHGAIEFYESSAVAGGPAVRASISAITQGSWGVGTDLAFSTKDWRWDPPFTEKMRILSTGAVGIGTSTPANMLNVIGDINAVGTLFARDDTYVNGAINATGASPSFIQTVERVGGGYTYSLFKANAKNTTTGLSSINVDYGVAGNFQSGSTPPSISYAYFSVGSDASYQTPDLVILPAGNIGIGTTSPLERLHVNGNVLLNDNNKLYFGDAKDASIYYTGTDLIINPREVGTGKVGIGALPLDALTQILQIPVDGKIGTNLYSGTYMQMGDNLTLGANGTIAIRPSTLGSSSATNGFNISQTWNTSGSPTMFLMNVTNTASGASSKLMDLQAGAGGTTSMFTVYKDGNGYFAGNVGIGTTTPANKLNVVGDANFTTNIYQDGNFFGNQIYGGDWNKADTGFETVDLVTIDTYVRATKLGAGSLNGFTVSDGNLIATYSGLYQVTTTASIERISGSGEYGMKGFVNDTAQNNCYSHFHLDTGSITANAVFSCFVRINAGQNYNTRFDNHDASVTDLLLNAMNTTVVRVGN